VYTNKVTAEDDKEWANRPGEQDIFFVGDDNNRNAVQDPYTSTLRLPEDFEESLSLEPAEIPWENGVSFLLSFKRGKYSFKKNYLAALKLSPNAKGQCVGRILICSDHETVDRCKKDGWTWEVRKMVVHLDVNQAIQEHLLSVFSARVPGNERNDIKGARLEFLDLNTYQSMTLEMGK